MRPRVFPDLQPSPTDSLPINMVSAPIRAAMIRIFRQIQQLPSPKTERSSLACQHGPTIADLKSWFLALCASGRAARHVGAPCTALRRVLLIFVSRAGKCARVWRLQKGCRQSPFTEIVSIIPARKRSPSSGLTSLRGCCRSTCSQKKPMGTLESTLGPSRHP
jgi:hypothetical protein